MAPKNQKPLGEGRGMKNGVYRSGKYKGKTTNLTKKQVAAGRRVGKAGQSRVGKKTAQRAMKEVKIQDTTWKKASERTGPRAKGGILVNKDGKPVTGTVTLASGKKATYVRGKRVAAVKKTTGGRGGSGGSGGGGMSAVQQAKAKMGKAAGYGKGAGTPSNLTGLPSKPKPTTKGMFIGANKPITKGEPPNRNQGMSRPRPGTTPKSSSSGGRGGSKKPIYYANGTASVVDPKTGRRITVGKTHPLYPKR